MYDKNVLYFWDVQGHKIESSPLFRLKRNGD